LRLDVDHHQPGFVQMKVFSPFDRPEEIWLGHLLDRCGELQTLAPQPSLPKVAQGIPKGLKLVPGETEIRHFEHIC
jgi:hypothetical protein